MTNVNQNSCCRLFQKKRVNWLKWKKTCKMSFYSTKLVCVCLLFADWQQYFTHNGDNDVRTFVFNVPTSPVIIVHKKQSTAVFSMKFINRHYFPGQSVPYKVRRNNDIKTELSLLRCLIMLRIAIKGTRKSVKEPFKLRIPLWETLMRCFTQNPTRVFERPRRNHRLVHD